LSEKTRGFLCDDPPVDVEEAKRDIVDYIEMFYNSKRRHFYLGYLSPKEFEKMMFMKKAA